jgi:asparagine synthase (glutamine-hydrolysing)
MTDALQHRGPDGSGHYLAVAEASQKTIALGHRRLSIIDLATGDQPLHIDSGRYSIIFNGEIYNYVELRAELKALGQVFRTQSDTEVLLRAYSAWGHACLSRLRGMFAFAIWDRERQELVLARDPFGKKPLLYFRTDDDIVFASELRGLVVHPSFKCAISEEALARYFVWKYVPGSSTLIEDVEEVPPGHFALWRKDGFTVSRYYRAPEPPSQPADRKPLGAETVRTFRAKLAEAVRLRLRSDVPLGAFLSGGIDSSAIVALMASQTAAPVKTFSIGFAEEEYSELQAARLIAERFRTDHHEQIIVPENFLDRIEEVSWHRGAPLTEMADVPLYLLSRLAARHVKVVLSGEGSDELLAGYPKHWGELSVLGYQRRFPPVFDIALSGIERMLPYRFRRLAILLRVARERDFVGRQAAWFGLMGRTEASRLCPGLFERYQPFVWSDDLDESSDPLSRSLRFDKTVWLPGTLLERGDRMTMAASIEGRMPFMDTELCEYVTSLAPPAFLDGRTGKQVLRLAMADLLPREIRERPKVGFRVPVHEWLRGRLKSFAGDRLLGPSSNVAAYCDRRYLHKLWTEHQRKVRNREKELWSILALEIFLGQLKQASAAARDGRRSCHQAK